MVIASFSTLFARCTIFLCYEDQLVFGLALHLSAQQAAVGQAPYALAAN
jgi:hypothetical protein